MTPASDMLKFIFGPPTGNGFIALSFGVDDGEKNRPGDIVTFPNTLDGRRSLVRATTQARLGQNVFLNGALRTDWVRHEGVMINQTDFHSAHALWCDVDDTGQVHTDALQRIRKSGAYCIANSGRGQHHRLALAQAVTDRDEFVRLNAHFAQVIGGGDEGHSVNENLWLTWPGSIRYKPEYPEGRRIEVVSFDASRRHRLEPLRRLLSEYRDVPEISPRRERGDAQDDDWDGELSQRLWADVPKKLRRGYEKACDGDFSDLVYGMFWKECAKAGLSQDLVLELTWHDPYQRGYQRWSKASMREQIAKAYDEAKKAPPAPNRTAKKGKAQVAKQHDDDNIFEIETAEVEMELTRWLWDKPQRIPLGELVLMASFEGSKKSMVCVEISARITRGELPGEYFGTPKTVIYLADEDSWSKTVVPRLAAAGADRSKVIHLKPSEEGGRGLDVTDPDHRAELRRIVEKHDVALIVLDPIISSLGGKVVEKEEPLREALTPLIHMAQEMDVSLLGIKHFTKIDHTDPAVLMGGARTWSALARAYIAIAPHPDDVNEPNPRMVLGIHKCNLTADRGAVIYEARQKTLQIEGFDVDVPYVGWLGDSPWTPREALKEAAQRLKGTTKKEPRVTAYSWLMQYLIDAQGPDRDEGGHVLRSKVIEDHNAERGDDAFSDAALDKAWRKIRDEGNSGDRKFSENKEAYWSVAKGTVYIP